MSNPVKDILKKAFYSKQLNKPALRLYSRIKPPPYQRAKMEFDFDVWNGICTFHSNQGRQIGENNTGPEVYKEVVETEHKICKFEGSRYGLPINVTALREVMGVWDDALQFVTLLRNQHVKQLKLDVTRLNLRQGYVFSKLGAGLPAYLARRRNSPIKDGSLPPLETAFFTLGVGPFMVVRSLMEKGDLTPLNLEPQTAEVLYELADTSGSIVSGAGKACAGSKKLFLDFLDAAMNGTYKKELSSAEAQRAFAMVDDWDNFYRYIFASSRLELLVKLNQALCAQSLLALQPGASALPAEAQALLEKCLERSYHRTAKDLDDQTVLKNFIEVSLTLLEELNCAEIRPALNQAGLAGVDVSAATVLELCSRIRRTNELFYPYCRAELERVHAALDQFKDETITVDDLYVRSSGVGLAPLLAALEKQ